MGCVLKISKQEERVRGLMQKMFFDVVSVTVPILLIIGLPGGVCRFLWILESK